MHHSRNRKALPPRRTYHDMTVLLFYSNPDCPLCDEARELLREHAPGYALQEVHIEGDLALTYRYGVRIPVLRRTDNGRELGWPFDAITLERFLGDTS
jgi:glutaredoxin